MPIMSRLEYLAELNRRLMEHEAYQSGMEFVFHPPGAEADDAIGFHWLPAEVEEPMRSIATEAGAEIVVREAALPEPPSYVATA